MPAASRLILYVADQARSAAFYRAVLACAPRLDVPGMTEFDLPGGGVLGLMPEQGIRRLLGDALADPALARGVPRCELYLLVDEPAAWQARAVQAGARELSPLALRDWGHDAAYSLDPDGHVLAFAAVSAAEPGFDSLRERIRQLDVELLARVAERMQLARRVGELKRRENLSTVDFAQERVVLERARAIAQEHGLDPGVAEDLFAGLIRASVTAQADDHMRHAAVGAGKTAVIVGGAGRMGRWLGGFLSAQGYTTLALDVATSSEENDWARRALPTAELVVCSTPPIATAKLYAEWSAKPPAGVVVDIASIKTPLIEPIRALQRAGGRVASIHPMFGPSAVLLRDADVVICDTGDAEAAAAIEQLFAPTTVRVVHLPLAEHDRIMADLLSLAHATAIAFALALPTTDHPVRSTTFHALEWLAAAVVRESPDVYYEIQAMNPHSAAALERLRAALDRIVAAVTARDAPAFRALLDEGRRRTPDGN